MRRAITIHRGTNPASGLLAGLAIMAFALVAALILLAFNSGFSAWLTYPTLLPSLGMLSVLMVIPGIILYKLRRFSLVDPLVFGTIAHFFPGYVIGGLSLAFGLSTPYYLDLIRDPESSLPWTAMLVMIGYAGLAVGYFLPIGLFLGNNISRRIILTREPDLKILMVPALILVASTISVSLLLAYLGFSYNSSSPGSFDGVISLLPVVLSVSTFFLWFLIFRREKSFDLTARFIVFPLVGFDLLVAFTSGSRGVLLSSSIRIALAYVLSGKPVKGKQIAIMSLAATITLVFGMIYGTIYRYTAEGSTSLMDRLSKTGDVVTNIGNNGESAAQLGLTTFLGRIDELSSLAVVVSNYEILAPYEADYGLDDNIRKDILTSLFPRFLWPDKPVASDPKTFSTLYFEYGENSFAITNIGDLLRNFGNIGVFAGMLILGIYLRLIYTAFASTTSIFSNTFFFALFSNLNYEAFYGMLFPHQVKTAMVALATLGAILLIGRFLNGKITTSNGVTGK